MKNEALQHPQVAVRAIITNSNNEVLILKRSSTDYGNNKWCLPGGKNDFGDSAEEALIKEIEEETSLKVTDLSFLFFLNNLPDNETELHFVTLFFKCACSGEIKLNNESSEYRWISSSQVDHYELVFENDKAIKKYDQLINQ
ncbi:MAG: NUDIX hydrolase [Prolixibacteraceae bacterium]|nr:NUDIX hydrolase [Prolixibacteraceae bacterium]